MKRQDRKVPGLQKNLILKKLKEARNGDVIGAFSKGKVEIVGDGKMKCFLQVLAGPLLVFV